jgi:alcohol dehydrogenase
VKAAIVHDFNAPMRIQEFPDPELRSGAVIVKVLAAFVPAVMNEFTRAQVPFKLPAPPFIPGPDAVGEVVAVADDVHGIAVGEHVYCDDNVSLTGAPHITAYVGLGAMMPGGESILKEWPNGSYAEQLMLPAECITPLAGARRIPADMLSRLGYIGTSYGAILRGNFQPGQIAVVNGATGVLGVGTVLLLLALGAARVVALGRKPEVLEKLKALDPNRVATVIVSEQGIDPAVIVAAAGEPAQLFIDAIGFTSNASLTLAGINALGLNGYAVLVGGVNAQIPITYATQMIGLKLTIRGAEWFPAEKTADLLRMMGSGMLDLSSLSVRSFSLDDAQQALDYAQSGPGGFEHVAIVPGLGEA